MTLDRLAPAAAAAALALAISPWGIAHLAGRADLSFRVWLISAVLSGFVLVIAVAALATGRARRFMFHVVAIGLPFAFLACLEAGAIAVHLADRVAPLEDKSVFAAAGSWPGHLMSEARFGDSQGVQIGRAHV